ncbi:sulfite exporter TauE/SafE family protein [Roseinatronobacter alkalisoli]|uniref:Probable membrane transporter protein n=1 Tax=Roseinatronobacter alkalisoli TaxID=3028235 RepID=A0ABT5TBE6_9RHOB|nr:sulfite exporter TauE/SafE family protein [Roseinatronobacter sp. HJB301]MDD7972442.1 sulfite exporter TauE/SafE family protein [Roseinatronobacter sp. HJB301]
MLELLSAGLSPSVFLGAVAISLLAGLVKGALGFAMPMIMISGFSSIMPVELALAGLALPTLVTNISQAFRQGSAAAFASVRVYWRMLLALVVCLLISAQMLTFLPRAVLLAILGGPIVAFAVLQLLKVPLRVRVDRRRRAEWISGAVGGLYGGVSGVWGPPVMMYLISVDTGKRDMVRVLGVVFLVGAIALVVGHSASGVLNAQSIWFSTAMVVPGMIGLWLGYAIQDRLNADTFRRWTLIMLVVTGLNLLRQAAGL